MSNQGLANCIAPQPIRGTVRDAPGNVNRPPPWVHSLCCSPSVS